ncbi:aryl-sulfate sulfotransferase [Halosegnis marinus]|uniref:Aryl-sulfate sulfotransferase n=1 Tax=Halosegnis marinus TaxID=3034023 RepID=A0ABD5ZQ90_9EURY|nr:aryl-sulfate sulfotransferase [Halosegnis sp. DT85]
MNAARAVALAAVVLLSSTLLAGVALSGDGGPPSPVAGNETYPGQTLIGVQAEGWFGENNGYAAVVAPNGSVIWQWSVPDSRVFDTEHLRNGNILVSVAVAVPAADCPDAYDDRPNCVHNRVVEVDYDTKEVVWEYDWYDVFPNHHEVHDADRLPNGETAVVDMGNDRAFTVNEGGEITWQWNASEHIARGTDWFDEHVPEGREEEFASEGPESDWTHMNDIDLLENGHFTLSVRNFDVVLEVDRAGDIVRTYGSPGDHGTMNEQHNPNLLERRGTMLVADSENDRIVEIDRRTERIVWEYARVPAESPAEPKALQWPRDADRLPNGNTLITDSRQFRVVEVTRNGTVAWSFDGREEFGTRTIVYEADRIRLDGPYLPEEPDAVPAGVDARSVRGTALARGYATLDSWLGFALPAWMGPMELLVVLGDLAALGLLARELR